VRELKDVEADRVAELTHDGMSARDIAKEMQISKSKVNRIQKRLREEGAR
jgi:transposase